MSHLYMRRSETKLAYSTAQPPPSGYQQLQTDVVNYVVNVVGPNLVRRAEPTLDKRALSKLRISQGEVQLSTGEVLKSTKFRSAFFRPMPPSTVSALLDRMEFTPQERDYNYFTRGDPWVQERYSEASDIFIFMSRLVASSSQRERELKGGGPSILTAYTPWRIPQGRINHISKANPLPGQPPVWSVLEVFRPCHQDRLLTSVAENLDTSKPHIFATFASDNRIDDRVILTGEAQAIMILACRYGACAAYLKHRLIPVNLLTCSKRTFRVVQGIVDLRTKEVEIRLSKKVKLPQDGPNDMETFYTLLGWMLATPMDQPLKR